MYIAAASGQKHVYCKLVELNCGIPECKDKLVIQKGGLHTSICFLKAIGNHISSSGFVEAWVESGPIGSNASEQVMNGKRYKRAMRTHKITLQALWKLPCYTSTVNILLKSLSRHISFWIFYRIS